MSVEKVRSIPVESEVLWRYRSNEIVRNYILFFFFFLRRVNNDVRVPLCGTAHAGWHQNVFVPFCLSNSRGRLLLDWLPKNVAFILLIPGRFILILLACVSPNGLNWSSLWEFPPDRIHSWSLLSISQKCELVGKKMHRSSWFCFMWLWHTRTYREDHYFSHHLYSIYESNFGSKSVFIFFTRNGLLWALSDTIIVAALKKY